MTFESKMADIHRQLALGGGLHPAQIDWLVKGVELQNTTILAGDAYIKELQISAFQKDMQIHELKETLAQNGKNSPRN